MRIPNVAAGLGLAVVVVLVQGCAVQVGPNGNRVVGVDEAELLGRKISTFTLPGGGTGALRVVGNQYSLKLDQYFRVIPMGQAKTARVVRVEQVGDRATILVEVADNSCDYKYHLFSIKGGDVLSWNFYGDCKTPATSAKVDNEQQFEFRGAYQVTRYTHRDTRLFRSDIPLNRLQQAAPAAAPSTPGVSGPRYVPGAPSGNAASTAPTAPPDPVRRSAAAPRSAPAPRTTQAAPQPAKLEFPAEEQKAIRIVLDK